MLAIATIFISGFAAYMKFGNTAPVVEEVAVGRDTVTSSVPTRTFPQFIEPEPVIERAAPATVVPAPVVPVQPIEPVAADPLRPVHKEVKAEPTLDKASSRSKVFDTRVEAGVQVAQGGAGTVTDSGSGFFGGSGDSGRGGNSDLASSLTPTRLTANSASVMGNRDFILTRGAFIDCALNTRLDSTVAGMTSCVVTRDVFSSKGTVVMLEKGSLVTGEYRSNLVQGMNRIFVLWSRVETPNGVVIDLDSPATDSLGGSGIPGKVDTHFWKRFGGAMLLSLIDDVARAATQRHSGDDTQIILNGASNVGSDLAAEVLRNTINIPPTLYANQGARVGIFVARDLDFSGVYDLAEQ